ncbi:LamG-like jellyroll fold domain-containing protein [Deinococcus oregonensis]|uniref:LamG-like jellyroll fold domain-containing protein n=1 Tax=Deinococcus oregonensis TaxID=1805970 RepID=A0ABV6B2U0_9DEIO
MPNTAIMTIPGVTFTNPLLPKLEKDAMLTTGVLGLWDALSTDSWPPQAAPTGAAKTLINLGRSGPALDGDISTDFTWAASGGLVRSTAVGSRIDLGAPDLSTGSPNILLSVWVKLPSVPAAFTPLFSRLLATGAGVDNQVALSIGSDGKLRADLIALDTDGTTMRYITMSAPNVVTVGVHQFAFNVSFSGNASTYSLYQDGASVASSSYIGAKLNPSTLRFALGNRHGTGTNATAAITYYRAHLENLTLSGRTAATVVSNGYTNNVGRFS